MYRSGNPVERFLVRLSQPRRDGFTSWLRSRSVLADVVAEQLFFGLAMALFEFPSGYLADRLGYRRTLLVASMAMLAGWSVYLVVDRKREDETPEGIELTAESGSTPDVIFRIDRQDLAFLRSIGIDPTRKLRRR